MSKIESKLEVGDKVRLRTMHTIKPELEPDLNKTLNVDKEGCVYTGKVIQDNGLGTDTYIIELDQEKNDSQPEIQVCLSDTGQSIIRLNGSILEEKNSIRELKII